MELTVFARQSPEKILPTEIGLKVFHADFDSSITSLKTFLLRLIFFIPKKLQLLL